MEVSYTFTWDATNRRVAKVFPEGSDFADVEYAYSNWQVLGEYEDGQTYPARQFVYGNYIDEPLVMDVNADASGSGNATCIGAEDDRYFYHAGQIYSVAAMSDASATIVEGWRYDPYGRHVRLTDGDSDGAVEFDATDQRASLTASALGNPYTFTGRRFDPETQLHYYRYRFYDSRRGRFITRDPIGYKGGINLYGYTSCNPVNKGDLLGLCEDEKKDVCGPDITDTLQRTLEMIETEFRISGTCDQLFLRIIMCADNAYSGQRSSMVYPNGRQLDYAYNNGGQLSEVDDTNATGDPIAAYDYIGGRVLRRAMENGIDLDYRDGSGTLYDAAGRATVLVNAVASPMNLKKTKTSWSYFKNNGANVPRI